MKRLITTLCFALFAAHANATPEIEYYTQLAQLPFSKEEIYDFQLASSCKQYSEEQLQDIKPYTEKRLQQQFDLLEEDKAIVALATKDGELVGVSWLRPTSEDVFNMRQTNANSMDIYLLLARSHFSTYEGLEFLTMKLPEARVPLFKQMFAYASPEETPPFTDDDEDFHGKIKFVHFRITRPEQAE